jgi:hypothetical protein
MLQLPSKVIPVQNENANGIMTFPKLLSMEPCIPWSWFRGGENSVA